MGSFDGGKAGGAAELLKVKAEVGEDETKTVCSFRIAEIPELSTGERKR